MNTKSCLFKGKINANHISQSLLQKESLRLSILNKEIISRDKTSLDITWLKDKSLADLDNLPDPETIAEDIIENLEAGLESFREIMIKLNYKNPRQYGLPGILIA